MKDKEVTPTVEIKFSGKMGELIEKKSFPQTKILEPLQIYLIKGTPEK